MSLKLCSIAGIPIKLHITFLIFLPLVVWYYEHAQGWLGLLASAVLIFMIFASVLMHELGHAFMARFFGVGTRDIVLYPIAGVARLERMPSEALQEFFIALAGPAVNIVIACMAVLYIWFLQPLELEQMQQRFHGSLPLYLAFVNVLLAVCNMIPAFPLDGGRAIRALLGQWLGPLRATTIAVHLSKALLAIAVVLTFYYPEQLLALLVTAPFVYLGATFELQNVQRRELLKNISIGQVMIALPECLDAELKALDAANLVSESSQDSFPVLQHERLVGTIARRRLLRTVTTGELNRHVYELMTPVTRTTHEAESLAPVLEWMDANEMQAVPVLREQTVVGIVSREHLYELFRAAAKPRNV